MLVPQRCVSEVQGNYFVMRVNKDSIVEQVSLELGEPYRDYFIVKKGLSAKDQVVFEGLQRAINGSSVKVETVQFNSQYKGN